MTLAQHSLIPQPLTAEFLDGEWIVPREPSLAIAPELSRSLDVLKLLLGNDGDVSFQRVEGKDADLNIRFDDALAHEAYTLKINEGGVTVSASQDAGVFYALQTLRQLLPVEAYRAKTSNTIWSLPYAFIKDEPRFSWRGMHLDVSRHFMPVEFVKKFIDLLAMHKMNRFHWHLTEDQGWRIEIKKYPKLTEIGSTRAQTVVGFSLFKDKSELEYDGVPHGGFYTQDEIREVVAFAAERYVTIVPEIEFPGHAQAAIAAYPELGNTGRQLKVKEEWGISKNTIKPSDETLDFYRDVLREVIELFPSKYIHIGGDEAPKDQWKESEFAQQRIKELGLKDEKQLQSWLIQQMDDFLSANGRTLIGWDEIMQGGLSSNATVMAWRGFSRAEKAARAGHDVIMAPTSHTYFDYYQADKSTEPLAIGSYISLEKAYQFEPVPPGLDPSLKAHILGGQGQLWTEFMKTPEHVEYMAFPRAVALAEVLWSPKTARDFESFQQRLPTHLQRLNALNVNYRPLGNDQLSRSNAIKNWMLGKLITVYHWYSDL